MLREMPFYRVSRERMGKRGTAAAVLALLACQTAMPVAASPRLPAPIPSLPILFPVAALGFTVEDILGVAGQETAVAVTLPSPADLQEAGAEIGTFMLIRNVPQMVSFSAGMSTGRVWVIPLRDAGDLRLVSEPRGTGSFRLEFSLIGPGNRVLAIHEAALELRSSDTIARQPVPVPQPTVAAIVPEPTPRAAPAPAANPVKPVKPVGKEEEARLLQRGDLRIKEGVVSEARLIFKWLAERGSGPGALALARSYDEAYVSSYAASGVKADMKEARRWYERAAELENTEAQKRLSELPAR